MFKNYLHSSLKFLSLKIELHFDQNTIGYDHVTFEKKKSKCLELLKIISI